MAWRFSRDNTVDGLRSVPYFLIKALASVMVYFLGSIAGFLYSHVGLSGAPGFETVFEVSAF